MYDLIIIGAGPAGLTASIYTSCYRLKHLVLGKEIGGQLLLAPDILNYPGFEHISGKELADRMFNQAKKMGGEIVIESVTKISHNTDAGYYAVETQENQRYQSKSIILATGTERQKLNVLGEVEYTGRGVLYCATCEKFDYAGKICGVVGGANSAVQAVVQLAQAASKVYLIYRGATLRGDPIWLGQVENNPKISVIYNTTVVEILGDGEKLTGVKLQSTNQQPLGNTAMKQWDNESLPLDKLFIEIGGVPGTALVIPLGVSMDPGGYIQVNEKMETNVPGIFAAGDLVSYGLSIEQISTAVGLGARAAASAFAYVKHEKAATSWGSALIKR